MMCRRGYRPTSDRRRTAATVCATTWRLTSSSRSLEPILPVRYVIQLLFLNEIFRGVCLSCDFISFLNPERLFHSVCLQWSRNTPRTFLTTWPRRSSGRASFSRITSTEIESTRASRTSSPSVPNRMRKVQHVSVLISYDACPLSVCFTVADTWCAFPFSGLKSMVTQGVKNPMVDLLALEDKTLDEVRDLTSPLNRRL